MGVFETSVGYVRPCLKIGTKHKRGYVILQVYDSAYIKRKFAIGNLIMAEPEQAVSNALVY